MKFKFSKKTLWLSIVSVMACVAMLAGATFAWFTDTVTSKDNIIEAGDLKVRFDECEPDGTVKQTLKDKPLFTGKDFAGTRWQPGDSITKYVRVKNVGTLPLQYQFSFKVANSKMDQYMQLTWTKIDPNSPSTVLFAEPPVVMSQVDDYMSFPHTLEKPKDLDVYKVTLWFDTQAGNEVNRYQMVDEMKFEMSVNAEQVNEDRSWYNASAKEFTLTKPTQLIGFANIVNDGIDDFSGKTVKLGNDINLDGFYWPSAGFCYEGYSEAAFRGTFDGQNYTVSHMWGENGLIGYGYCDIKNVNIDNAFVNYMGSWRGVVAGYIYGNVTNCHVTNSNIDAPGKAVGGLVGYMGEGNFEISDCTVDHTYVKGMKRTGGLVGALQHSGGSGTRIVKNCHADNGEIDAYPWAGGDSVGGDKYYCAGALVGEVFTNANGETVFDNCSSSNVVLKTMTLEDPTNCKVTDLFGCQHNGKVTIK